MPFGFGLGNLKVLSGSLKSFIQQPRTIQMARQAGGALAKYAPAGSRSRGLLKLAAGGGALAGAGYGLSELTGGEPGMRKHRRMNPLNGRAAARAIRRITQVRHMLKKIERQMPKRPCGCRSRPSFGGYRRKKSCR